MMITFWVIVTDNGVTHYIILKEPPGKFDGLCEKSVVLNCFPLQCFGRSWATAESTLP